ncbi:phosphatase 2A regulatory subunit-related protein, putative [Plasmodium sp. gorilla clade G2]|uniref:phosphatase 2A regulatory subunit-related protein, putative n=1 Tax=Plasmodium sp. gorilla clade G2 TaxID=880535 RepID=UPI000D20FB50|nr:phosphatase 2A regulatory subunit-related protein, putative [Plasmodium sp. gorilla clade G2]SOV18382.1 phosphatase 2A regulatory subunit-related protein, putative [Plasmodium sp. gorilla clade G2]
MNRKRYIINNSIHNENMNVNMRSSSGSFSEKSDLRDLKYNACMFLQGELMRQFLMDEDIWLFMQNVKMKLKENPNEMDMWLDTQLHMARLNSGHSFNSDIPPSLHTKTKFENSHLKPDKEYEKMFDIYNENDKTENLYYNKNKNKSQYSNYPMNESENVNFSSKEEHADEMDSQNFLKKILGDEYKEMKETNVNVNLKIDETYCNDNNMEKRNNDNLKNNINLCENIFSNNKDQPPFLKHSIDKQKILDSITNKINYIKNKKKQLEERSLSIINHLNNNKIEDNESTINSLSVYDLQYDNLLNDISNKNDDSIDKSTNSLHNTVDKTLNNNNINNYDNIIYTNKNNLINNIDKDFNQKVMLNNINFLDKKNDLSENNKTCEYYVQSASVKHQDIKENITKIDGSSNINNTNNYKNMSLYNDNQDYNLYNDDKDKVIKELEEHKNKLKKYNINIEENVKNNYNNVNVDDANKLHKDEYKIKNNNKDNISIPKMTITIGELIDEDTDIKLQKMFNQCNNKMDLNTFENEIVVNFLKIGRYMSHTLFSRVEKSSTDFVTYENFKKFFSKRFIDGEKDPSFYNDERYKFMFNKKNKDFYNNSYESKGMINVHNNNNDNRDILRENEIANVVENNQKGDHIDVPYRKCSVINFFNAIKEENKNYIEFKDFDIYIREILKRNKSLQFLLEHTEFLERYIESVIVRIYYYIDINDTNKIYLNDLRKHDLAHIWCFLDDSVKVQHIKNYFSYSHFYVYYCTFCQTSSCKDMLIDDNDLYRFDNHSLNDFIVNRIWSRISMKLGGPNQKYMCLNDWIYFIMNYEDMTTNRSIEFWFKLIDLDADCVIRDHEIQVFFHIQTERLKSHYLEEPKFEDWMCQMNDAIQPSIEGNFTLSDFKKNKKYASKFFGCLVSLSKLLAWESRDVHKELQIETEFPCWTPWEIFCKTKYDELCYIENESYYDENFDNYDNYDKYDNYDNYDKYDGYDKYDIYDNYDKYNNYDAKNLYILDSD